MWAMKRLLAVLLLLFAPAWAKKMPNLIVDPSFENNGPEWQFFAGGPARSSAFGSHSGTFVASYDVTPGGIQFVDQTVTLTVGAKYEFSFWYKYRFGNLPLRWLFAGAGVYPVEGLITAASATGGWQRFRTFVNVTQAQCDVQISVRSLDPPNDTESAWLLDDVAVATAVRAIFRVTPQGGPSTQYDLSDTGFGGPTEIVSAFVPEKVQRMTPSRRILERRFGFRREYRMHFTIDQLADEAILQKIINATLDDQQTVEISVDDGQNWQLVHFESDYARVPLGGKSLIGLEPEIVFTTDQVLTRIPPLTEEHF